MHLSAFSANLTKHKWTVLFCYSGGMEEGWISVRHRNGWSSHFSFASEQEAVWDNHQPCVGTTAEHRLPPGRVMFQHAGSTKGQAAAAAAAADRSAQQRCTLTARQGSAGCAWRCGEIESGEGLQHNNLHHCRILPLISPTCLENLQPTQVISVGAVYGLSANCLKFLQLRDRQLLCRKTWHSKTLKNSDITQGSL